MPKKSVQKKHLVFLCSSCSLIVILLLTSFNINFYLNAKKVLGASVQSSKNDRLQEEKTFWENFLAKNPTYLDGWLELAKIEFALGDENYALGALNTAKAINPNSQKVKDFEKTFQTQ